MNRDIIKDRSTDEKVEENSVDTRFLFPENNMKMIAPVITM